MRWLALIFLALLIGKSFWASAQKLDSLFSKSDSLVKVGRYQSANQLIWKALNKAISSNDYKAQVQAYARLAFNTQRKGDYQTSIKYCETCKQLAENVLDTLTFLRCNYYNARNFLFLALYRNASEEIYPALKLAENYGNKELLVYLTLSSGNLYRLEGNDSLAIQAHKKALALAQNMPMLLHEAYNNLGVAYFYAKKYDLAYTYYDSALRHARKVADVYNEMLMLNNFGLLYNEMKRFDLAKEYLESCMDLNQKNFSDLRLMCYTLQGLAKNSKSRGLWEEAKSYAMRAIEAGRRTKLRKELSQAYSLAAEIDSASGNWKSAFLMQKKYAMILDSIRQDNLNLQAHYFEQELERERERNSLKQLQTNLMIASKEKLLAEEEVELQRERSLLILAVAIGLILAVAAGLLLWHSKDVRQKNLRLKSQKTAIIQINQQLELRNQEINLQKEEISAQAEHLNQLNDLKDRLFYIMSHELKGPLSSLGGVINLFESGMLNSEETVMLMKNLRTDFSVLNEAFTNIFLWSNAMNTSTVADKTTVPLLPIFGELSAYFGQKAREKNIALVIEVPKDAVIWADRYHVFVLFKNLIDNAIKFTPSGGRVSFEAQEKSGHWEISVRDTGVGIRNEDLPKLFDLHTHFKTFGTLNERGAGLGLLLCKEFAQKNDGKIWVESHPNQGCRFVVAFPKYDV
jgi:signal transduction histidine kinase